MKINRETVKGIAVFSSVLAIAVGTMAHVMTRTVERQRISSIHWVVPYQVACVDTKMVPVTFWDESVFGRSHRWMDMDGIAFRLSGKIGADDDINCTGDKFTINYKHRS
jgi:hypothetical protein